MQAIIRGIFSGSRIRGQYGNLAGVAGADVIEAFFDPQGPVASQVSSLRALEPFEAEVDIFPRKGGGLSVRVEAIRSAQVKPRSVSAG
jgi:hypothetical protein